MNRLCSLAADRAERPDHCNECGLLKSRKGELVEDGRAAKIDETSQQQSRVFISGPKCLVRRVSLLHRQIDKQCCIHCILPALHS